MGIYERTLDGNMAALDAYMREQEKQEQNMEKVLQYAEAEINEAVEAIENLKDKLESLSEDYGLASDWWHDEFLDLIEVESFCKEW